MKIFIILITYNGSYCLWKTLIGVNEILSKNRSTRLIIVDNNSKDLSLKIARETIPTSKIIKNSKNLGFAKAVNIGIKYALGEKANIVLLLNQDTYLDNENFTKSLKDLKYSVWSPVIKFKKKGKWFYDYGGKIEQDFSKTYHLEKNKKILRNYRIDYVSGCCMFIKSEVFKKIGVFDERFFLYYEDVDFCLRASMKKFEIGVYSEAEIEHDLTEVGQRTIKSIYFLILSNFLFLLKWVKWPKIILSLLCWLVNSIKILGIKFLDYLKSLKWKKKLVQ